MNSKLRAAAALAALIASAAPAHADWEGTTWGMSPEAALAALDGATPHTPDAAELFDYGGASYSPLVKLSHPLDGIEGDVSLLFDADEALQFVVFVPSDIADCDELSTALTQRHGATEATGFGSIAIYNWEENGDIIRFTNSVDSGICNLSYGPV